jgi:integrase
VALYLAHRAEAGLAVPTVQIDVAAIKLAHEAAGHPNPTTSIVVRTVMRGIRRTLGVAAKGKAPVLITDLRKMVHALPETNRGRRDAAVLVVGFAGAFRRSELIALDVSDVTFVDDGVRVAVKRGKTDQEGRGRVVGLPFGSDPRTCPVRVLRRWMDVAGITGVEEPVFRTVDRADRVLYRRMSSRAVARAVQRAARRVGIDPDGLAGHSLRSGFCTSAAKAGATERSIMRQTGHRSVTVLRMYIREGTLWQDNAATLVGL